MKCIYRQLLDSQDPEQTQRLGILISGELYNFTLTAIDTTIFIKQLGIAAPLLETPYDALNFD